MAEERERCAALIGGKCKNWFPVSAACEGIGNGPPFCMSEQKCARLFPETGWVPDRIRYALREGGEQHG